MKIKSKSKAITARTKRMAISNRINRKRTRKASRNI